MQNRTLGSKPSLTESLRLFGGPGILKRSVLQRLSPSSRASAYQGRSRLRPLWRGSTRAQRIGSGRSHSPLSWGKEPLRTGSETPSGGSREPPTSPQESSPLCSGLPGPANALWALAWVRIGPPILFSSPDLFSLERETDSPALGQRARVASPT